MLFKLIALQVLAGGLAGWALEKLLRTQPQQENLGVRWRPLAGVCVGVVVYSQLAGKLIADSTLGDAVMAVLAVLLLIAMAVSFAVSRRLSSGKR